MTNLSGCVVDSLDYLPFGMLNSVGSASCTATDTTHKFTGKERDPESNLDNFGARYDSSQYGRFMTPDPLLASGLSSNPQTWNRYAYTLNNPLHLIDPNGLAPCTPGTYTACPTSTDPAQAQSFSAGQVAKDTVEGAAKSIGNNVIDLSNTINGAVDAVLSTFTSFQFGQTAELQGSTSGERSAMIGTDLALLVVPGGPEEAAVAAKGTTSVYTIVKDGKTVYAGITNNLARRAAEHGAELTKIAGGLTRTEARGVEQALIEHHGLENLTNKINSIARSSDVYEEAVQFGRRLLQSTGYTQ